MSVAMEVTSRFFRFAWKRWLKKNDKNYSPYINGEKKIIFFSSIEPI